MVGRLSGLDMLLRRLCAQECAERTDTWVPAFAGKPNFGMW
jgi:hypothetical protein